MSTLDIIKLNIRINAIKIVSVWGASLLLVFKGGQWYNDFSSKMKKYDYYEVRIDSLEKWRNQLTVNYQTKKNK